jgi:hypothetical protein
MSEEPTQDPEAVVGAEHDVDVDVDVNVNGDSDADDTVSPSGPTSAASEVHETPERIPRRDSVSGLLALSPDLEAAGISDEATEDTVRNEEENDSSAGYTALPVAPAPASVSADTTADTTASAGAIISGTAEAAPPSPSADATGVTDVTDAATVAIAEADAGADAGTDADAEDPVLKDYYFLKGRRASLATSAMVEFVMTIAGTVSMYVVLSLQRPSVCV